MSTTRPSKSHRLKTIAPWFRYVWEGAKNFEVRYDDRGFQAGDLLVLAEFLGTPKSNAVDRVMKGRGSVPGWAQRQLNKTHCPAGHEYAGENLIVTKRGSRACRSCRTKGRS